MDISVYISQKHKTPGPSNHERYIQFKTKKCKSPNQSLDEKECIDQQVFRFKVEAEEDFFGSNQIIFLAFYSEAGGQIRLTSEFPSHEVMLKLKQKIADPLSHPSNDYNIREGKI